MYFINRAQAGRLLAKELEAYSTKDAIVIALNEGSVILGAQIAMRLHTNMVVYLSKNIFLPGENDAIAGMSSTGTFTYNSLYSSAQIDDMSSEFHQFIDQKRLEKRHELNILMGDEGEIKKEMLRHRTVILVADGLASGMSLDLVADYLKTIAIKKLVIAAAIVSVSAVDRMHLLGDEIHTLTVTPNFMGTDHYYEDNTIPSIESAFKIIRNISLNWRPLTR
ncbi:MAG: hypothetical protein NVSMB46_00830 [Candidatus Saccharimonadales bacterium]